MLHCGTPEPGHEKGAGSLRPLSIPALAGSAVAVAAVRRSDLGDHLAVDHRQAIARLVVHADGVFLAFVAVGDLVGDGLVLLPKAMRLPGLLPTRMVPVVPSGLR